MMRHPALEPFSRDHNVGLVLARHLQDASAGPDQAADAVRQFREAWVSELMDHFAEEERLLIPLATSEHGARLLREHRQIAAVADCLSDSNLPSASLHEAGIALEEHIRWEERELFPALENSLSESQLSELVAQTDLMEERRWNSPLAGRRKELVLRRRAQRLAGK